MKSEVAELEPLLLQAVRTLRGDCELLYLFDVSGGNLAGICRDCVYQRVDTNLLKAEVAEDQKRADQWKRDVESEEAVVAKNSQAMQASLGQCRDR